MSYESPIRVFIDDMADALTTALVNDLPEAVMHCGIAYAKGYADGWRDAKMDEESGK